MKLEEKKIKICFISSGLAGGGMERSLTNIANFAAASGYKVTILNLFKTEVFYELHPEISIIRPNLDRQSTQRFIYALKLIPYIRKHLKRIQPDTVLSFGEWFNAYVIITTRFMKIPVYVSDRMGPLLNLGFLIETARKIMYKYATGIIAQTSIAQDILYKKTRSKNIIVIPNALNVIITDISVKKKQIVTIGRLAREKGHAVLIKAFVELGASDWTLHIVGDGKERSKLESLASELGVSNRVVFYGHLQNFSTILGHSEIFVLPSYYEGFPNALLEAMSVPLACISSDCVAGPGDIIQHDKNGLLVEPDNVDELVQAIEYLISDIEMRGKLAREAYKVREKYNIDKIAIQYLDFITQRINIS